MVDSLDKDTILANITEINDLIDNLVSEPNKTALKTALDGEFGNNFFTAPASSKTQYHLAVPGGLAHHCLNVWRALKKLNDSFDCKFSEEDMFLSALLHDLCKASAPDLVSPHYKTQTQEWLRKKGEVYERDYTTGYLTNRDRTSYLMQALGLKVSFEIFQATLISDGPFTAQNQSYGSNCCDLSLFLHFADFISSIKERN